MALTSTRIDEEYLEKLRLLAKINKRSMAQHLHQLLDDDMAKTPAEKIAEAL